MGDGLHSYGFHRIRRGKGTEVAMGIKEAFSIFRLWDMWTVREKAEPTFECNGKKKKKTQPQDQTGFN